MYGLILVRKTAWEILYRAADCHVYFIHPDIALEIDKEHVQHEEKYEQLQLGWIR